ncbi:MAG: sensor domain-containing diguanylate cyclase [Alphaproteobacteria bacterium]|nr:MAG: sensor domain-containing diguanylate cyclase [Alphaproteobacteria bacterium]
MAGLDSIRRKLSAPPSLAAAGVCALRVNRAGAILDRSPAGEVLQAMWLEEAADLRGIVARTMAAGVPAEERMLDVGGVHFWVVMIPDGDECLIVARDTTLADKVTEALMKSRAMFRELLDRAVDMAFELDEQGHFIFITPAEAFGQRTEGWLGLRAADVFWSDGTVPARDPFAARMATSFDAVPVSIEGQEKRWVQFGVHPQADEAGHVRTVRATCRDVTKRYRAERQTKLDNLRMSLLQRITEVLNTEESAQDLLDSASRILADILRADMVWAVVKYQEGLVPISMEGTQHDLIDFESIWGALEANEPGVQTIDCDGRRHLAIRLERGDIGLGMVIVSRDTDANPWSAQEEQLLNAVAGVLTAAFGKAELIDKLYRLSSKDELTSLLNRRALAETIERRLRHQGRTGQAGCLLFIDLDYFKEVNDTLGHAKGDEALVLVASHLQSIIRPCDYAGRYGGDEFIVWLEDVSADVALAKGQSLLDAMPKVRELLGNTGLKLSASVGVCATVAGKDIDFDDLADRADQALYRVKHSGRGGIAIAAPIHDAAGEG